MMSMPCYSDLVRLMPAFTGVEVLVLLDYAKVFRGLGA
jgi:hypothetical protein